MAGLGVSDEAGGHGRLGAPAPLQVAHRVLVQVTCHHGAGARPHATRGELHAALRSHRAGNENHGNKNPKKSFICFNTFLCITIVTPRSSVIHRSG